jgi:hypothetical protein
MNFKIVIEGTKSLQSIQHDFAGKLSSGEIKKTIASALNITARRVITQVRKDVKKTYTVDKKYLERMAILSKPAKGTVEGLYAGISYLYNPVPMIGFKHTDNNKSRSNKKGAGGVTIEIKKGKNDVLKHAFIATMASGHTGIYAAGQYKGKNFIFDKSRTASGKQRITEMKTSSPLTMITNKNIQKATTLYVEKNLPTRLRVLLQQKVDKLTKKQSNYAF